MSAKQFCDRCETELLKADGGRLRVKLGIYKAEVITAVEDRWNGGDICHSCVKQIIATGKPYK